MQSNLIGLLVIIAFQFKSPLIIERIIKEEVDKIFLKVVGHKPKQSWIHQGDKPAQLLLWVAEWYGVWREVAQVHQGLALLVLGWVTAC